MGDNLSAINFFRQAEAFGLNGLPIVENKPASEHQLENPTEGALLDLINNRTWQAAITRRVVESRFQTQQAAEGELNGLSERRAVNVTIKAQDTQADVLRRAYQIYATTAGLNEENTGLFVKTMMDNGDNFIHHRGSDQAFTAEEFRVLKQRTQIEMFPTAGQIAELRRLKAGENDIIKVESKAYAQTGQITFQDTEKASQNYAVVRRYLQQNLLGADFYFVDHGDEATRRALELGVKPDVEAAGKTQTGETLYSVKITPDDAEKLQQVKTEYEAGRAQFTEKMAQARNETNQMFADQGRVLWNSAVNIVEGTVNTAIDAALTNGGSNPLPLLNPYRPQADFSGAKMDYRSEMMRRDIHGKVDGNGIKAGQAIETGVTVLAPLVVGMAVKPVAPPQTLESLGALPKVGPLEGKVNFQINDPKNIGRTIVDVDRFEGKILWEEKSATSGLNKYTGVDETTTKWIPKHITKKFEDLVEARQHLPPFYRDAEIGFDFVKSGVDPNFRAAVEAEIRRLSQQHPDIKIHVRWR